VIRIPWALKFAFAAVSDTVPICAQRRKPYIALGWGLAAAGLLVLAARPLPPPYWCVGADGSYVMRSEEGARAGVGARGVMAAPCHPASAEAGGPIALLICLATAGAVMADVAADGLLVELAQAEPPASRGRTQTACYMWRSCGMCVGALLVGALGNSRAYGGTFGWGVSFNQACAALALPCAAMALAAPALLTEPGRPARWPGGRRDDAAAAAAAGKSAPVEEDPTSSLGAYARAAWRLVCSRAVCALLVFQLVSHSVGAISTPARSLVQMHWAHIKPAHNQLAAALSAALFALGLHVVRSRLLHASWRLLIVRTSCVLVSADLLCSWLTVFDHARTPWLMVAETLVLELPLAVRFMADSFVIVEVAQPGVEGLTYGMMSTASNVSSQLGRALGKQFFGGWAPSLSDAQSFIGDSDAFRAHVFSSYLCSYAFGLGSLALLPLLPDQREETRRRLATWSRHWRWGALGGALLLGGIAYGLAAQLAAISPRTACSRFAGGGGCARREEATSE
jgi:hypothetical protein